MIYFLYGSDNEHSREKANSLIGALQKKKPDAAFFKMTDESFSDAGLEEYMGGQGLFSNKYIVFLDNVFRNKEAKESVVKKIKEIGASENIFIFLEEKIDKATLTKIEKNAEKIQQFEKKEEKEKKFGFNIFSMTDALGARDKKNLWLLYVETLKRRIPSEEVSGILFWQVKNMLVAKSSKNASEAGLNPFVFSKSSAYAKNFSDAELKKLSSSLVAIYHDAHRGIHDFEIALERFVLGI